MYLMRNLPWVMVDKHHCRLHYTAEMIYTSGSFMEPTLGTVRPTSQSNITTVSNLPVFFI